MKPTFLLFVAALMLAGSVVAREEKQAVSVRFLPQKSGVTASLRGASAVDAGQAWVTGTGGTVLHTIDGGDNWLLQTVPGADSLDFRDVEALNSRTVFLMSAGAGNKSRIFKSEDAGRTWALQFINLHPEGFLDGFAFRDDTTGIAYGDPVDGRAFIIRTYNGGETWTRVSPDELPPLNDGEYGFAASGTGIFVHGEAIWICTGGAAARVMSSGVAGQGWRIFTTPILHGTPSAGIFSIVFADDLKGVAVGGDYAKPTKAGGTIARTRDGGKTWHLPEDAEVTGFRSCVAHVPGTDIWVAVGSHGAGFSADGGESWQDLGHAGYHTLSFSRSGDAGWAAGADGNVAKVVFE